MWILGLKGLSKGVFERRTSTGSEVFSLIVCLEATKFVLVSVVILCPKSEKGSLPVVVRRSKTSLLKLAIDTQAYFQKLKSHDFICKILRNNVFH